MVNLIEDKFKGKYEKVTVILYKKNWDLVQFFKTQGYDFNFFVLKEDSDYHKYTPSFRDHNWDLIRSKNQKRCWKERKIKISDNVEKQIFINPTARFFKDTKTEKDFWLRLAEKLKKETDYKVVFRSHSPNPKKFKDYSNMKIHDLFLKVFGKNTIVLAIRSGFMDLLKTCDLKKVLLLQSEKAYSHDVINFSKNKNHQMHMKADFEYFISENFGNQEIEKIIASIKKT